MKERRTAPIIAAIVAAPLLLFVAYMGSYYVLVKRIPSITNGVYSSDSVHYPPINREFASIVFWPAHQLDHKLRPSYWDWCDE